MMQNNQELKKFARINSNVIQKMGVQALSDRPNASGMYGRAGLSAKELKEWFDKLATYIAENINATHDIFATDEIASYIKLALDEYDMEHLQDLIDSFRSGKFADEVLYFYSGGEKVSLSSAFQRVNQKIADELEATRKKLQELGYGYTDAEVHYIEDDGEIGVELEFEDHKGGKKLVFTFHNITKGAFPPILAPLTATGTFEGVGESDIDLAFDFEPKTMTIIQQGRDPESDSYVTYKYMWISGMPHLFELKTRSEMIESTPLVKVLGNRLIISNTAESSLSAVGYTAYYLVSGADVEKEETEYGEMFDTFPAEVEILGLPDNSYFTVRGRGATDGVNRNATYFKTTSWIHNALHYKDGDKDIYVTSVTQPCGEIYLPDYGIRTGEDNATRNSEIMESLLEKSSIRYGVTFKFPAGHFYFKEPIDLTGRHISIIGCATAGFKNLNPDSDTGKVTMVSGTTFLHFENLAEGQAALTVDSCTISDFTIIGSRKQYTLTLDRTKTLTDLTNIAANVVQEIETPTKACGIYAKGPTIIKDIGVCNFYYGCYCKTANMNITNVAFHSCNRGLSIEHDVKVSNIFGFDVMVLLQMRGSVSSAIGVRGDSVGENLVEITGNTNGNTLVDLDADYCMGAIVAISGNVKDLSITGVHGRAGVQHTFDVAGPEFTAENVTDDTVGECGVIAVKSGGSLEGAIIITNQKSDKNTPFDDKSVGNVNEGYSVPFILLTAASGSAVKSTQIFTTTNGIPSTEWVTKRIVSLSDNNENICDIVVRTSQGTARYIRDLKNTRVINEADDIRSQMDLSSYAKDAEVIKTINGISANDDGDYEIPAIADPAIADHNGSADGTWDQSKRYVLNNEIWVCKKKLYPDQVRPAYTNLLPKTIDPVVEEGVLDGIGYKHNVRYTINADREFEEVEGAYNDFSTGLIVIDKKALKDDVNYKVKKDLVIRINEFYCNPHSSNPIMSVAGETKGNRADLVSAHANFSSSFAYESCEKVNDYTVKYTGVQIAIEKTEGLPDPLWIFDVDAYEKFYVWFTFKNANLSDPDETPRGLIITIGEEIEKVNCPEGFYMEWVNTGEKYEKVDIQQQIAYIKKDIVDIRDKLDEQCFHLKLYDRGGMIRSYPYKEGQTWKDFLLSTDVSDVFTWKLRDDGWIDKESTGRYLVMATPNINGQVSFIRNPLDDERFDKSSIRYDDIIQPVVYSFYCDVDTHVYEGDWLIGEPPTKKSAGYRYRKCIHCGEIQTTQIAQLGENEVAFIAYNDRGKLVGCGVRTSGATLTVPSPNNYNVTAPMGMTFSHWHCSDGNDYNVGDTLVCDADKSISPVFVWT